MDYYKGIHNSNFGTCVLSSSNPNESDNATVKNTPEYKLTNKKGLSVVEIVSLLQEMDYSDYNNLMGVHCGQNNARPFLGVNLGRGDTQVRQLYKYLVLKFLLLCQSVQNDLSL